MNAFTAFAPGTRQRVPMPLMELIPYCDRAVEISGTTATAFGRAVGNSTRLLPSVRDGQRRPGWRLRLRMEDHATELLRRAKERAFNTLMLYFERNDVEAAVDGLIAMLDAYDGDPEAEEVGAEDSFTLLPAALSEGAPGCPIADPDYGMDDQEYGCGDRTHAEWHTLPPAARRAGKVDGTPRDQWFTSLHEDAEDDDAATSVEDGPQGFDPEEDCCLAGDDGVFAGPVVDQTNGQWRNEIGDEADAERKVNDMGHDIPSLPVHALEPDPFTGKRANLGRDHLLTSFRTNGDGELSATTGRVHRLRGDAPLRAGVPV